MGILIGIIEFLMSPSRLVEYLSIKYYFIVFSLEWYISYLIYKSSKGSIMSAEIMMNTKKGAR